MSASVRTWVVKVGGAELVPGPGLAALVTAAAEAVRRSRRLVLVHGGGEEVSKACDERGLPVEKRRGQRVTTEAVREVVAEVLAGRVNVRLVNALESAGVPALGLTGVSGGLLEVRPAGEPPGELGWVGEPTRVDARLLATLLDDGYAPVLAPLGVDGAGGVYNVNADRAAAAVAAALAADLVMLTDVPAVLDAEGRGLAALTPTGVRELVEDGTAHDGMIPKLEAAVSALAGGATSVWIGDLAGWGPDGPRPGHGTTVRPGPRAPASLLPLRMEQVPHGRS